MRHEVSLSQLLCTRIEQSASKSGKTVISSVVCSVGLGGSANVLATQTNDKIARVPIPAASSHAFDEGPSASLSSFPSICRLTNRSYAHGKQQNAEQEEQP